MITAVVTADRQVGDSTAPLEVPLQGAARLRFLNLSGVCAATVLLGHGHEEVTLARVFFDPGKAYIQDAEPHDLWLARGLARAVFSLSPEALRAAADFLHLPMPDDAATGDQP